MPLEKELHKRSLVVLIAFALGALVSTGLVTSFATGSSDASPPKLSSRLLSLHDMPAGWNVYDSAVGNVGCLSSVLEPKGIKQTARANASFQAKGILPTVNEGLATFASSKIAYKKIDANLAACRSFSAVTRGGRIAGTNRHLSFPHYGDAIAAFAISFALTGVRFGEDLLIVREGAFVMGIDEGAQSTVNVRQFEGFIKKALQKL